ncbi:ribonuclease H1 domain-containing protein [Viscerimonas tarda]
MSKKKFYVVWKGVNPGVYDDWDKAKAQVMGYEGAVYKSFPSKEEADRAIDDNPYNYFEKKDKSPTLNYKNNPAVIQESLAVDAACSGNPGLLEYRGVYLKTGEQVFHQGPFEQGTNNIGEFLAIVHGLALLKQKQLSIPLYSDSANAIKWVKEKKCKTKLERKPENLSLFYLIERAEKWLHENTYTTRVLKWETKVWGEIPADFGRK